LEYTLALEIQIDLIFKWLDLLYDNLLGQRFYNSQQIVDNHFEAFVKEALQGVHDYYN